jgi:hypothetical protein
MSESKPGFSIFFVWFSMTISVVASVLILISLFTQGIQDIVQGKDKEFAQYLPFLLLAIAGSVLSFFKRKPGATMMIIGGVAVEIVLYIQSGMANFGMMVVYGVPYIFPGIVLLLVKKTQHS